MKRGLLVSFGIAVICVGGLALILWEPRVSWHQEVTLHFDTPGGPVEASTVTEVSVRHPTRFSKLIPAASHGLKSDIRGEAIVAELGDEKLVFALLENMDGLLRTSVYYADDLRSVPPRMVSKAAAHQTAPLDVRPDLWPQMVTFEDLNDPSTVLEVDADDLTEHFGAGYALRRITVRATQDPVTEGRVEKLLPCLNSGHQCIPLNKSLPFGHPLRNILNVMFRRT